jgi:hypothetical protein
VATLRRRLRSISLSKNSSSSKVSTAAPVAFSNLNTFGRRAQTRRIQMTEYIGQLSGSTSFAVPDTIILNPGLSAWFPWLSSQASDWQQYRFHSLSVHFITQTSTSTTGSVTLVPSYNQTQPAPQTILQAMNSADSKDNVAWQSLRCDLEPSLLFPIGPRKLLRSGNVIGDLSVYDAGRVFVCTDGQPSTAVIGKLALSYDVEFFGPQSSTLAANASSVYISTWLSSATLTVPDSTYTSLVWGTNLYNPLNVAVTAGNTVFAPPAGAYRIMVSMGVFNSTAEAWVVTARLFFNGASTNWGAEYVDTKIGGTTNAVISMTFFAIIPFSGSDYFDVAIYSSEQNTTPSTVNILGTVLTIEIA